MYQLLNFNAIVDINKSTIIKSITTHILNLYYSSETKLNY